MGERYLDEGLLEELRGILEEEFPEVVQSYIKDSAVCLQNMQAAFSRADADALRRAAHSLKGASANLGLEYLAGLCSVLEEAALEGRLAGQHDRLQQIAVEQQRAATLLRGCL